MKTNAHSIAAIPIRTSWAHVAGAVAILTTALSLVMIAFAWPILPAGALGDLFGRKRVLLNGLAILGSAPTAAIFMSSPQTLIALRR